MISVLRVDLICRGVLYLESELSGVTGRRLAPRGSGTGDPHTSDRNHTRLDSGVSPGLASRAALELKIAV